MQAWLAWLELLVTCGFTRLSERFEPSCPVHVTCTCGVIPVVCVWREYLWLVCCLCLQAGMGRIRANLESRVKKGAMSPEAAKKAMSLVSGELTYDNFKVRYCFTPLLYTHALHILVCTPTFTHIRINASWPSCIHTNTFIHAQTLWCSLA